MEKVAYFSPGNVRTENDFSYFDSVGHFQLQA